MKLKPFSYCKETFRAKCSLCIYIHSFSFSTTHVDWQLQWADIHFNNRIQYKYILSMKWKVIDKFHKKYIKRRWNILLQFKTRIPKHKVQTSFIFSGSRNNYWKQWNAKSIKSYQLKTIILVHLYCVSIMSIITSSTVYRSILSNSWSKYISPDRWQQVCDKVESSLFGILQRSLLWTLSLYLL